MGNPDKTNHTVKDSTHLKPLRLGSRSRKSAGSGRSLLRMMLALLLAAGFCLAAVQNASAAPTQLGSTAAVDGITSHGNVLPFTISSGSDRILIVTVDDEEGSHVDSVALTSHELLTNPGFENGLTGWTSVGDGAPTSGSDAWASSGPHSGSNEAYWDGVSDASYLLYQDVDLSAYAAAIDAGSAKINATGWLRNSPSWAKQIHTPTRSAIR